MEDLKFFDANCRIGDDTEAKPGVAELLKEMDYYGVDRALVRHGGVRWGALPTNEQIARFLREDAEERLTGVWCILPDTCGELPPPDEFFRQMRENRIGALTLSPFEHRYLPRRLLLGRIMDAAAERRIPILLDAFAGKWNELYDFMAEFPRNTCIYVESWGKWGSDRNIRPLLETYENFYFETAGYWVPEGIREFVTTFGAERILYGSNFPTFNHGNGMLQIKHSGLDDRSLAMVAGGSLERLLKGAQL